MCVCAFWGRWQHPPRLESVSQSPSILIGRELTNKQTRPDGRAGQRETSLQDLPRIVTRESKPKELRGLLLFLKKNKFIYLFLAVLGLRFCARAFSSCGKRGPLFIAVRGPLTVAASPAAEHRLQTRRLSSCGSRPSRSAACGIFLDQGTNPCPLHWQADS